MLVLFFISLKIWAHTVYTLDDLLFHFEPLATWFEYIHKRYIYRSFGILWLYSLYKIAGIHFFLIYIFYFFHNIFNTYLFYKILKKWQFAESFSCLSALFFFFIPFHEQNIFSNGAGLSLLSTTFILVSIYYALAIKFEKEVKARWALFYLIGFYLISLITYEISLMLWVFYFMIFNTDKKLLRKYMRFFVFLPILFLAYVIISLVKYNDKIVGGAGNEFFAFKPFAHVGHAIFEFIIRYSQIFYIYCIDGFRHAVEMMKVDISYALLFLLMGCVLWYVIHLIFKQMAVEKRHVYSNRGIFIMGCAFIVLCLMPFFSYRPIGLPIYNLYMPSLAFTVMLVSLFYSFLYSVDKNILLSLILKSLFSLLLLIEMVIFIGRADLYLVEKKYWSTIVNRVTSHQLDKLSENNVTFVMLNLPVFDKKIWYVQNYIPSIMLSLFYHNPHLKVSTFMKPKGDSVVVDEYDPVRIGWNKIILIDFKAGFDTPVFYSSVKVKQNEGTSQVIPLFTNGLVADAEIEINSEQVYGPYLANPNSRIWGYKVKKLKDL